MSAREDKRERLLAVLEVLGGRKAAIPIVAEALTVSVHTVTSWTRPETSMSAREIPAMALELLAIKQRAARSSLQSLSSPRLRGFTRLAFSEEIES